MPWVVDLIGERSTAKGAGFADSWTLSRLDGTPLDESMTLPGNGIHDGDVLLLANPVSATSPCPTGLSQYVVDALASDDRDSWRLRRLGLCAWWWSAGSGAVALAWPNPLTQDNRAIAAAIVAVAATVAAVVAGRAHAVTAVIPSAGAMAVIFGGIAGFLVVPGGPAPPNFFLAAAVCAAISAVLLRLSEPDSVLFIAVMAISLTAAIVTAAATIWPMPCATFGALLAAASVALLSLAAKMTVVLAGLSPHLPDATEPERDSTVPLREGVLRAKRGHRLATGLLAGFAFTAAMGAVLVVSDPHGASEWSGIAFAVLVSSTLVFRAGQQRGAIRSVPVLLAALISASAAFTATLASAPHQVTWMSLIVVTGGAGALFLTYTDLSSPLSPPMRRGIECVNYLALTAVVPMACWVSGVFGLVRGLPLS